MMIIQAPRPMGAPGCRVVMGGIEPLFAAAPGASVPGTFGRRTGTGATGPTATLSTGFVSRGTYPKITDNLSLLAAEQEKKIQAVGCLRLLETGTSLLAYHLPLDAHPEVGNNACLARELNLQTEGVLDADQAAPLASFGRTATPLDPSAFAREIGQALGREPLWIPGAAGTIHSVGWCTGAAQDYIHYAVSKGLDAFVSGEVSERTTHVAREEGVHYFAAGHHATERYGVQALGAHLAEEFSLTHRFIEVANPV